MGRLELLLELARAISDSDISEVTRKELEDVREKLLLNQISNEQAIDMITHGDTATKISDWFREIRNKPVYKNMKAIIENKLTDQDEIAKTLTSLLTQMIIQKQQGVILDYNILSSDILISMISDYFRGKKFLISEVRDILYSYQKLEELNLNKETDNNVK